MKQFSKNILSIVITLVAVSAASFGSETPAKKQNHPVALVGADIHTVSGSIIEHGTIIFDQGKITAIGANLDLPQGAERIDVKGKHVYPGMINATSNVGLSEVEAVRATRDLQESGSINPNVRAEVALNPESEIIPVTRANGVTLAMVMPEGGVISGTSAVIMLDGWTWEDLTFKAPAGLVVNWPRMTINRAWWEQRSEEDQKMTRDKALNELRYAFRDARAYLTAKRAETKQGIPFHNTDLRWEAMAPVFDGQVPVLLNGDDIQQIQAAVAWSEQEGVKLVVVGGYDTPLAAGLLKEKHIPVIISPIHQTPRRQWEPYDAPFTIPKKLYDAGVKFCIATGSFSGNERNLPYEAATAAAYGLPKDEALKSVTLYPAQILGIADRVGSLEIGKDATVIVTNGDPLESMTNVEMEFIQGRNIPLTSRHTRFYDKYKEKYERLKSK